MIVLNLLVYPLVRCKGDYSSFYVISFLVYGDAAPGVFGYPECGSSSGIVDVIHCLGVFRSPRVLLWPSAPFDCPSFFCKFRGVCGRVCFVPTVAILFQLVLPSLLRCEGEVVCALSFCAAGVVSLLCRSCLIGETPCASGVIVWLLRLLVAYFQSEVCSLLVFWLWLVTCSF